MKLPEIMFALSGGVWRLQRCWPSLDDSLPPAVKCIIVEATPMHGDRSRRHAALLSVNPLLPEEAQWLRLHPYGQDAALPALTGHLQHALRDDPSAVVVAHRRGKRAVIRSVHGFIKVLRPGKAPALVHRQACAARYYGGHAVLAALLQHDDAALTTAPLAGRTLAELGNDPSLDDGGLAGCWFAFGSMMRRCQRELPADWCGLPQHCLEDEWRIVDDWLMRMMLSGQVPPERVLVLHQRSQQLCGALAAEGVVPLSLLHRDLHDKQVLFTPDGPALLDFDTLALGDAALDLGNVLAHLRLRAYQHAWCSGLEPSLSFTRFRLARQALLNGWAPDEASMARANLFTELSWIRLTGVYQWRPAWQKMAKHMVQADDHQGL